MVRPLAALDVDRVGVVLPFDDERAVRLGFSLLV